MNLNRVDLNLFVVFDAIYTEGGITRASRQLNLSQPAISHALGRLRELFGDPLFERHGRAMVPTPLARGLIEPVRRSLRGLELTLNEAARFEPFVAERQFTLSVRDVLEATLLAPLMSGLATEAPRAVVQTVRLNRRDLEAELGSGKVDLAIDALLPLSGQLQRERLAADPLVVLVRRDHPLVGDHLDLEAYLARDHILVSSRRSGQGLEDVELARIGRERRLRLRCQHYFAACRVVSQTDLVLTMPQRYALLANRAFDNRILPFPLSLPTLDAWLYWHRSVDREPANLWLRRLIRRTFGGDSAEATPAVEPAMRMPGSASRRRVR